MRKFEQYKFRQETRVADVNFAYKLEAQRAWRELPKWKRSAIKAFGIRYKLGQEQKEGFTAPLPFFLFFCERCGHESKDYPHGHIDRQYLLCSNCDITHNFVPYWVPFAELWALTKFAFSVRFGRCRRTS